MGFVNRWSIRRLWGASKRETCALQETLQLGRWYCDLLLVVREFDEVGIIFAHPGFPLGGHRT
jgi:hypothetical protein